MNIFEEKSDRKRSVHYLTNFDVFNINLTEFEMLHDISSTSCQISFDTEINEASSLMNSALVIWESFSYKAKDMDAEEIRSFAKTMKFVFDEVIARLSCAAEEVELLKTLSEVNARYKLKNNGE
jgi:hypothetical protein